MTNKDKFTAAWIGFHALILAAFLISLIFSSKFNFATSLFDIMPPSSALREVQEADSALASKTGRAITILVKASSFQKAKSGAEKLYSRLVKDGKANPEYFDSLALYVDSNSSAEIMDWLYKNRFSLISQSDQKLLQEGEGKILASQALDSVYGAFSIADLSQLDSDPFLLTERHLKAFLEGGALSSTAMSLRDDVLACQKDDFYYVLLRGSLSLEGAGLGSKKSSVKLLKSCFDQISKSEGVEFIYSGVPFHSYESSTSAQRQITIISVLGLTLIVLIFFWIFRSLIPALTSALAVTFSCGIGFLSTLLFFRGIHVLTFVFGTTLIGTCLDYSIHYFVNWKGNNDCKSPKEVRSHILRGISLGFLSTEICFAALFIAPFPLLKQVSVFLFTGLASAFLTVVGLYPYIKIPSKRGIYLLKGSNKIKAAIVDKKALSALKKVCRWISKVLPLLILCFSLYILISKNIYLKISNNIQELYSMSPAMMENEVTSAKVLNTGSSGWYFLLKSSSLEELLQKNEELDREMEKAASLGKVSSWLSVSQFIPSEKSQSQSYEAAKNLIPLVKEQYSALGLNNSQQDFEKIYLENKDNFIHPDDQDLPASIKDGISNLWIGQIDGQFYSCLLPLHALKEEEDFFRDYAAKNPGVFFVNKVKDISAQLDLLSKTMLITLGLAFTIVLVILFFFYSPKIVLRIASIPILVTMMTTAILILAKISLSFFPVTSLILVFGLGLDYIIYSVEGMKKNKIKDKGQNLNNFAIFLSFISTALSFGALAISTFTPVHMMGVTVFTGLTTALVLSLRPGVDS